MNAGTKESLASLGLLIIRVGVGGYMATHGWGKVQQVIKGDFANFADPIGIGNTASLIGAAGAEFVCALLVVIGLGTRAAAIPVVFTMGVAAFVVHAANPWTAGEGYRLFMEKVQDTPASKEAALLFLIVFLGLVFTGAGKFSVDAMLFGRKKFGGSAAAPDRAASAKA